MAKEDLALPNIAQINIRYTCCILLLFLSLVTLHCLFTSSPPTPHRIRAPRRSYIRQLDQKRIRAYTSPAMQLQEQLRWASLDATPCLPLLLTPAAMLLPPLLLLLLHATTMQVPRPSDQAARAHGAHPASGGPHGAGHRLLQVCDCVFEFLNVFVVRAGRRACTLACVRACAFLRACVCVYFYLYMNLPCCPALYEYDLIHSHSALLPIYLPLSPPQDQGRCGHGVRRLHAAGLALHRHTRRKRHGDARQRHSGLQVGCRYFSTSILLSF